MTETTEQEPFDFTKKHRGRGRPALSPEERERRIQLAIDGHYVKNRNGILAKSREKTRHNRPEERLRNAWLHAFEALPVEEQTRISELNLDARVALAQAIETISAIAKNKTSAVPPDETYRMVADFVSQTGRGNAFPDLSLLAQLDAETFEQATADDLTLRTTGRFTKLPGLIFDILAEHVWHWCQANRATCDPVIFSELAAKFPQPEVQPVAQPIGYRNSTQREEITRETTKEFVRTQQQIGGIQL